MTQRHENHNFEGAPGQISPTFPQTYFINLLLHHRTNKTAIAFWVMHTTSVVCICGGAKVQVTGHRSGHRLQVTGHRSGYRPQATGQVTGQVTGHRSQATGQVTGHPKNNRTLDKTVLD